MTNIERSIAARLKRLEAAVNDAKNERRSYSYHQLVRMAGGATKAEVGPPEELLACGEKSCSDLILEAVRLAAAREACPPKMAEPADGRPEPRWPDPRCAPTKGIANPPPVSGLLGEAARAASARAAGHETEAPVVQLSMLRMGVAVEAGKRAGRAYSSSQLYRLALGATVADVGPAEQALAEVEDYDRDVLLAVVRSAWTSDADRAKAGKG
jgi:hypothetical protein